MKWIGQHIYDLVSRFRDDVYLEDISTGTIASGAHLGLDSNNKIVKAVDGGGDLTSIVAGTGLSGTSLTGPIPTLNVDASQTQITGVGTITTGTWRGTAVELGSGGTGLVGATDGKIVIADGSGAPVLLDVGSSTSITTLGTIATGVWNADVIASAYLDADTAHLSAVQTFTNHQTIATNRSLYFRDTNSSIFSPDANDIEISATDITLDAATSVKIETSDLTMYDPINDGNPTFSLGSSATNRVEITSAYRSGTQNLENCTFKTYTASSTTNDGSFVFYVDEVLHTAMIDAGLTVYGTGGVTSHADGAQFVAIDSTTSSATEGGALILQSDDGAVMADNHRLGVIEFKGAEDTSNTRSIGARIQAIARDAWDGSNNDADLEFYTTDGTTESKVLTLDADKLATFTGGVKCESFRPTGQIVLMRAAFKDDIATTKHYIPLQSELEQTTATHEMNSFVAPFAGKLLKLMYRGSGNFSGGTFTFTLEKITRNGAFATGGSLSTIETITATGPTNNTTDPNMITVNFVGGSGTNAFVAGDNIMVGIQSDTDVTSGTSKHFFTLVFEFDFSGLA